MQKRTLFHSADIQMNVCQCKGEIKADSCLRSFVIVTKYCHDIANDLEKSLILQLSCVPPGSKLRAASTTMRCFHFLNIDSIVSVWTRSCEPWVNHKRSRLISLVGKNHFKMYGFGCGFVLSMVRAVRLGFHKKTFMFRTCFRISHSSSWSCLDDVVSDSSFRFSATWLNVISASFVQSWILLVWLLQFVKGLSGC